MKSLVSSPAHRLDLPEQSAPGKIRGGWWALGVLLVFTLMVRVLYFTGMAMGDDTEYAAQVIAHAMSGAWPPVAAHWNTRVGLTLPTTAVVWLLGPHPFAFVAWPLLAGILKVLVCLRIARSFTNARTAYLAAILAAVSPLEVIYSTHLFPDVIVGLFSTLSIWCWVLALREDERRWYVWSGAFLAAGYLCRETVLVEGPIYLALWALEGRIRRPRLLWAALPPALILLLESGVYALTAGTPFYRWESIANQMAGDDMMSSSLGGGFLTDPILMAIASHEFGLFMVPSLIVAAYSVWAWPSMRPLAVWLIVGFVWLSYGTTIPTNWHPLHRDPRYLAVLTVPCTILLAQALTSLDRRVAWPIGIGLVVSSLFAAGLDQGRSILTPHRHFLATSYASGAVLEPTEYFGTRWAAGLLECRTSTVPATSAVAHCPRRSSPGGNETASELESSLSRRLVGP